MSNSRQQALFPSLPTDDKIADKDGILTPSYKLFFNQLIQALQTNLKPEGFVMPQKTADDISGLGDISAAVGNIIYDSTNNHFKGIVLVSSGPPVVTSTKTFTLT